MVLLMLQFYFDSTRKIFLISMKQHLIIQIFFAYVNNEDYVTKC